MNVKCTFSFKGRYSSRLPLVWLKIRSYFDDYDEWNVSLFVVQGHIFPALFVTSTPWLFVPQAVWIETWLQTRLLLQSDALMSDFLQHFKHFKWLRWERFLQGLWFLGLWAAEGLWFGEGWSSLLLQPQLMWHIVSICCVIPAFLERWVRQEANYGQEWLTQSLAILQNRFRE